MAATGEIAGGTAKASGFRAVFGWLVCILLALVFLFAGGAKLLSKPALVQEFRVIGLGQWFRYFTGALEVLGAIGVLIPRFSRWAALLLALVMAGAVVAHLTVLHTPPALPIVLLVLAVVAAWLRRQSRGY